jgi:hypothetical protein
MAASFVISGIPAMGHLALTGLATDQYARERCFMERSDLRRRPPARQFSRLRIHMASSQLFTGASRSCPHAAATDPAEFLRMPVGLRGIRNALSAKERFEVGSDSRRTAAHVALAQGPPDAQGPALAKPFARIRRVAGHLHRRR